ncbi:MAG: uracil-DNA glycosylase family protein [Pseudomonadota bacterium]
MTNTHSLQDLLTQARACTHCEGDLPLGANPVLRAHCKSRVLIVGQAPGTRVHASGIPWDDPSGDRLRTWLNVDKDTFYDERKFAIVPMGFCYPGKGKSVDLPPRRECAPLWHKPVLSHLQNIELTLLIGQYAQAYYLNDDFKTLTERVLNWRETPEGYLPLPHPSPRNQLWLKRNGWFERDLVPVLAAQIEELIS